MTQALQIAVEEPEALEAVTKWLYPAVARKCGTNWKTVERKHTDNDRDSLADCSRTTGEAVRLLFGEKAEPAQFLAFLTYHLSHIQ